MRFYKGMKKRLAKKRIGGHIWNRIFGKNPYSFVPKIGDLAGDCDGFNHIVKDAEYHFRDYPKGWIINDATYTKEDGCCFCGCMHLLLDRPFSAQEIQENTFNWFNNNKNLYIEEQRKNGWWTASNDRQKEFVDSGGIVCDDQGLISKEYREICWK